MSINPSDQRGQPGPVARARAMSAGSLAGEYPTQNDTVTESDNCDATHALNLDFVVPKNSQRIVSARLSFRLRAYRTYSNFSALVTGAGSNHNHNHNHGFTANTNAETGHNHNHNHALQPVGGISGADTVTWSNTNRLATTAAGPNDTASIASNAAGSSGHSHPLPNTASDGTGESAHTHPVSVSSSLGVAEGAVATGVTVALDGVDITAALGGDSGFNTDQFELDVGPSLGGSPKVGFHTLSLQPTGLGRIKASLRLTYVANPGVR